MKELTEKEALLKAARYCSTAEHCVSEVKEKLLAWGADVAAVEPVINYLIKEKYIDEARYCRGFVNDKLRNNKWGRLKIMQALWQKQLPGEISSACLADIDEEEYMDVLRAILASKKRSIKARNAYELNGKLIRFAMSRGFESEYVRRCISMPDEDE